MGRGTLGVVLDGSGEPRGGSGRVGDPAGRSGTGRRTFGVDRDGSENFWEDLGRVGGH